MTGWTREYILDELTFEEMLMHYDYGLELEELKASMVVAKLGQALEGKMEPLRKAKRDKPDRRRFHERYGSKIKRPGGEK